MYVYRHGRKNLKVSTLWMVGKVVQAYLTRVVSLVRTPPSCTEATSVCGLELLAYEALSY
jgi:hypothetical protein